MKCQELAALIERIQPDAHPREVARLCLLLTNQVEQLESLRDLGRLQKACHHAGLRLQVATDQHAAMAQELEDLAQSDPKKFERQQIWILVRAIKVQSQILEMYLGEPAMDV